MSVHWSHLLTLKLAQTIRDVRAAERLLDGRWPLLHTLDLNGYQLYKRFFARMVQGLWPLHLKHLTLAATPFHLAAISQLPGPAQKP